jgi:DNA-directed RNA polymerase
MAVSGIGHYIEAEYHFMMLKQEFPKLLAYMRRRLKRGWTQRSIRSAREKMGELGENWSLKQRRQIGAKLLELVVEHTGMVQRDTYFKRGRQFNNVSLTTEAQRAIADADTDLEIMRPLFTPMVVPPNEWAPGQAGGYRLLSRYHLVTKYPIGGPPPVDDHGEMVYRALNWAQDTPYRVNEPVLDVMRQLWAEGGGVADIPHANDLPHYRETEPFPEGQADLIPEWKKKAERVHTENARLISRRINFLQTVTIAQQYRKYEALWFPHNCDFRGRIYPLNSFLQPQGNDVARGLLTFADAKPLGQAGLTWLWIHLANCFGHDKLPMAERIKWVLNKRPSWHRIASDPLNNSEWMLADKPWQALACILELDAAMHHPDGAAHYPSSLPVSVDGSNSGLQHFSAMLRDEHGAKLVNLGPSVVPSDIYADVAVWVEAAHKSACRLGEPPETLTGWAGRINRKTCKRGTMTYVYGVTRQGLNDALIADGFCDWAEDRFSASRHLGKLIWQGIEANITGAAQAMSWLQEVAKKANARDVLLEWVTPSGFHVTHPYAGVRHERIICMASEVGFEAYDPNAPIRKHRQRNGIAPNVVHSMDAAHMTMTVCAGHEAGITHWMLIHDSFGTHACDVDMLVRILKEEFVKLYSIDVLADFKRQAEEQCDCLMPAPPDPGSFVLEDVYDSDYIFS